jgi:hypothetical protein
MATLKTWREPGLNWQVTVFRKLVQVRRWANIPYGPINAVRAAGEESRRQNLSVSKQTPKARCHLAFRRGRDQEPEATPSWKTDEITARSHCTSFGNYNPIRRCYCRVQFTIKVTQLLAAFTSVEWTAPPVYSFPPQPGTTWKIDHFLALVYSMI